MPYILVWAPKEISQGMLSLPVGYIVSLILRNRKNVIWALRKLKGSVFIICGLESFIDLNLKTLVWPVRNDQGNALHYKWPRKIHFRKRTKLFGHLRKSQGKCLLFSMGLKGLLC